MRIINSRTPLSKIRATCCSVYGSMTKAVVDVSRKIMALDAELHSDEEALLLDGGSKQEDLWGINLYPDKAPEDLVEFTSFINIRPAHGNASMDIVSSELRAEITGVVLALVDPDA